MSFVSTGSQQYEIDRLRRQLENLQRQSSRISSITSPSSLEEEVEVAAAAAAAAPQELGTKDDATHSTKEASALGSNDDGQEENSEMDRLRRQVSDLQRMESGRSPHEMRDFTVHAQEPSKPRNNNGNTKILTYGVGLISLVGIALAIMALVKYNGSEATGSSRGAVNGQIGSPPQGTPVGGADGVPPAPPLGDAMITFEELALHNTPDDCWVALHGSVYDLTSYARRHPGGASAITRLAGTDGTSEYDRFHSEEKLESVEVDIVGTLVYDPEDDTGDNNGTTNRDGCLPEHDSTCVSIQELTEHNTADDCWIAIYGHVYDLTEYANRHPGGARIVTELAGTDGTNEYRRFHREALMQSVQTSRIGPYEGGTEEPDSDNEEEWDSSMDDMDDGEEEEDDPSVAPPSPSMPSPTSPPADSDNDQPVAAPTEEEEETEDCWMTTSDGSDASECGIPMEVLALHNTEQDCWVGLHGNVYDLTDYADDHPAGAFFVTDLAGTDGTSQYDLFHRPNLLRGVEQNMIGYMMAGTDGDNTGDDGGDTDGNGDTDTIEDPSLPPQLFCNATNSCITTTELARHNTASDCWVAIYGEVYDLTNYARRHPGGASPVTQLAGIDGTRAYKRFHREALMRSIEAETWVGSLEGGYDEGAEGDGGMWNDDWEFESESEESED